MDPQAGSPKQPEILVTDDGRHWLALILSAGRMFYTTSAVPSTVPILTLKPKTLLFAEGNLTGIAYVELPAAQWSGTSTLKTTLRSKGYAHEHCTHTYYEKTAETLTERLQSKLAIPRLLQISTCMPAVDEGAEGDWDDLADTWR